MASRPQDTPFLILETDSDLDAGLYDLDFAFERAAPWGMPLPYKIAFDGQTRRVLGIWRNWKPNDPLYRKNNRYVKFGMVPGLGFHDWGFLQLLGNSTKALRAVTRLLLDGGLYSNFPGGVKLKGTRTGSNEIQPAPGEFVDIDAAGVDDIRKVIMGMPYKSIEPVFIQFAEIVRERAQRLGGTVEIETGEGRTNMPVGTIMSMIEQQTQVMAAVHKSNHRAQREELHKLRELFADNPKDLWRLARDPKRRWEVADEFMDLNLVPASDPNIPAQVHRIMQAWALGQIVMMNPQLYDVREVNRRILQAIRIASPETLLLSPQQLAMQAQQSAVAGAKPNDPARMAQVQQKAQSDQLKTQLEIAKLGAEAQSEAREQQLQAAGEMAENTQRAADRVSQQQIAGAKEETQRLKLATEFAKHGIGGSGALGNGAAMGMGAPEPMASAEEAAP